MPGAEAEEARAQEGAHATTGRAQAEAQSHAGRAQEGAQATDRRSCGLTIGRLLLDAAARRGEQEALVFDGERWSFRELAERSLLIARSLEQLGTRAGDHVGLLMANCPEMLASLFGIALTGAVTVPINTRFRSRELAHVVDHAELATLLVHQTDGSPIDYVGRLRETFPQLEQQADPRALRLDAAPRLRCAMLLGGARRDGFVHESELPDIAAAQPAEPIATGARAGTGDAGALILFTSGTTSLPKGCLLSHDSVIGTWLSAGQRLGIGAGDRVLDPLPLFHMGGIGPALLCLHVGATFVSTRHFEARAALDAIERERVSWLYTIFPSITMALIHEPSFRQRDLSRVRAVMNVAPPDTLAAIDRAFAPIPTLQGPFGMTEAGGAITCARLDSSRQERLGTTGTAVAGMEVRAIRQGTGEPLPAGAEGELIVRGAGLFSGYYHDDAATAASVDGDGWLHSGDLGSVDEQGRVTYVGRIKEMLKVGGENVAPAEIESLLSTHPDVKLAQVVPAPDPRLGEVPAAFVELVPGAALSPQDVIDFCEGKIASFKVPRHVRFLTEREWPMSATKVRKVRLREMIEAELGAH
ncbi:MAG: class I adenylate-forming enzyme family protein [Solirubrobacteraceae bacterium]